MRDEKDLRHDSEVETERHAVGGVTLSATGSLRYKTKT